MNFIDIPVKISVANFEKFMPVGNTMANPENGSVFLLCGLITLFTFEVLSVVYQLCEKTLSQLPNKTLRFKFK